MSYRYMRLIHNFYRFEVISISATKEEQLRRSLEKMQEDWKTIQLCTTPYKYVYLKSEDTKDF